MSHHAPLLLALAALLGGCAGFSPDGGLGPVQQAATRHLNNPQLAWPRTEAEHDALDARVAELLRQPLTPDAAVQVALFNHRGLRAGLHGLGIAEAELVQASRLPNPGFSFGRFKAGDEREIERGFHWSLARLIALPWQREAAQRRFEAAQAQLALQVIEHGVATRRAWVQAVAAAEGLRYAGQVMQAAQAGAELARRMQQVGNFSALQRAREQAFYADAALGVARAEQAERAAREKLTRLLGLWGEQATALRLPERLPDLPKDARELPEAERLALAQRLDVQGARLAAQQSATQRSLTRISPWTDGLELGVERNSSNEGPTQRGWELGFTLPIFDGGAAATRADHAQRQALLRAEQTAIDARSEVREAWGAYRSAHDIARHHRDEVVPLRKRILDENVLRYNGMLIGVFELLADARLQIASVHASIDALRDFWLAEADLDMALVGKPMLAPLAGPSPSPTAADGEAH
jgi:outer membrane protein TolC